MITNLYAVSTLGLDAGSWSFLSKNLYEETVQTLKGFLNVQGGYDVKIGTSERGTVQSACELTLPPHQHLLVGFGGPLGLEDCLNKDPDRGVEDVRELFDLWVNTCPNQGSRTIRTEEALLVSLTYLQPALQKSLTLRVPDLLHV